MPEQDKDQAKDQAKKEGEKIMMKRGYTALEKLDSGGQGNVYKTTKDGQKMAIKVVHIEKDNKNDLQRELKILLEVKHPNLIGIVDGFYTKHKVYIVMELMPNKSIGHEVDNKGVGIGEWKSKVYFSQMVCAIKYLHSLNPPIAHRDLKLDNVLLDQNFNAKVCDFGFSKTLKKDPKTGKLVKSNTFCGTPSYEPPEIIAKTPYDALKVDTWCLGICLFVMVNYDYPFKSDEPKEKRRDKQMNRQYSFKQQVDNELSANAKDMIRKLLEPVADKRMSIGQVLRHPWIPNTMHSL